MYLFRCFLEHILLFTLIVTWVKCLPYKDNEPNSSSLLSLFANPTPKSSDFIGSTAIYPFNLTTDKFNGLIGMFNSSSNSPGNRNVNGFSGLSETNITEQRGSPTNTTSKPTFVERVKTGASRIGEKVGTFFQNIPKVASGICLQRCACGCEHNRCKDCSNQAGNATNTLNSENN